MGKHKLREDKICQNCGNTVEERYCPKCGQENTETRQSFHYLFTHFIEDLVHYDGSFWTTMKYLLLKPGRLTKEYLSGKRQKFVAPVKLYIFVSFFVFFVGGMIGKLTEKKDDDSNVNLRSARTAQAGVINDSLTNTNNGLAEDEEKLFSPGYDTTVQYDSVQNSLAENERDPYLVYKIRHRVIELNQKYSEDRLFEKIGEIFYSNFPKFLFLYMPMFAFFMWLFYNKKKWMYFDHGIFTLHFFSFLLSILFIAIYIVNPIEDLLNIGFVSMIFSLFKIVLFLWVIYYFYKALRVIYQSSRLITFIIGSILLFTNLMFFIFGIGLYFIVIFLII